MNTSQIVEAVLFASDAPLKAEEIARADETLDEDGVEAALQDLREAYAETDRAFQVVRVAEGYQILTRPEFASYLERFDTVPRPSRLSGPALEALAIIAYRQPIGRVEVEYIRGVGSAGVIRTLQDRVLVEVVGRGEGLGRPLLYGTTPRFLEHFGFDSLDDLPRPEELPVVLRDNPPLEDGEDGEDDDGEAGGEAQGALKLYDGAHPSADGEASPTLGGDGPDTAAEDEVGASATSGGDGARPSESEDEGNASPPPGGAGVGSAEAVDEGSASAPLGDHAGSAADAGEDDALRSPGEDPHE